LTRHNNRLTSDIFKLWRKRLEHMVGNPSEPNKGLNMLKVVLKGDADPSQLWL
jgi:hypothetical protein